jgi:hypothetical protein
VIANGAQAASAAFHNSVIVALRPPSLPVLNCRFLIFSASSIPEIVTTALSNRLNPSIGRLRAETEAAAEFARAVPPEPLDALGSAEFLAYCKVSDVAEIVPEAFAVGYPANTLAFAEDLLDRFEGPLLITGPAGFGKTAFCRWHAIRDANRLVSKEAAVLPVYRPLYPLSSGKLGTFEEVFFASEELRNQIMHSKAVESRKGARPGT